MNQLFSTLLASVALLAVTLTVPANAQEWPTRPITLIIGFAPGGSADVAARIVSERLSRSLGVSVVVENRPGANGDLAAAAVKRATPDGYTLLLAPDAIVTSPAIRKTAYDPTSDFVPIAMISRGPLVLVTNPLTPAPSVKALIRLLKENPDKFSYGSSGVGNNQHFAGEKFKAMAGVKLAHIPYKGGGQAIGDLLSNQIPLAFLGTGPVMPHLQAGKLKVLAVTTTRRFSGLPDVPTLDESGLKGFSISQWISIVGPSGTPLTVVNKVNAAVNAVLSESEVKGRLFAAGMDALPLSPAALAEVIRSDLAAYRKLAQSQNMSD
jgi:tripartite-type tricarboxylate transporter receptor subunit TctC